ncbi:restriction endonuclease subunit S [Bacillus cereus]|nr:restriction endonuclease subunit S [Bacillus cereus]
MKLIDMAQIIRGTEPGSSSYTEDPKHHRFLRVGDISKKRKNIVYTNSEKIVLVNKEDLLMTFDGSPGIVADGFEGAISSGIRKIVITNNEVEKDYLKYFLKTDYVQKIIQKYTTGATILHASKSIPHITICYPSLGEQKKIVKILSMIEKTISKRIEANALTDDYLNAVFFNLFGNLNDNLYNWEVRKLGELSDVVSGVTKGRKLKDKKLVKVPYMRVANVQDGFLDLNDVKEIEVLESDIQKYRLLEGDVLLTEGGDPDKLGRGTVWRNEISNCIHQNHIFRVRVDREFLLPEYLSMCAGSNYGKKYFLKSAKQTTGIATINSKQLKSFPVPVPPIELQRKLKMIVDRINELKVKQKKSQEELNKLFKVLLNSLFKG